MAYDFGVKKKDASHPGRADEAAARSEPAPIAPEAESLPEEEEDGRSPMTRLKPHNQLVFGDDIWSNPVPLATEKRDGHLYVTFENDRGQRFTLDEKALSKHLLLLGGIGSGKTNIFRFILESLLRKQEPGDIIFVFDTKKDFYEAFYQPWNPDHILIGNAEQFADVTRSWNVFGEIEGIPGDFRRIDEFTAKEIGKQFFAGRGSENQPFFELSSADLVSKVMIDFERRARDTGDRSELNNRALVKWLKKAKFGDYMDLLGRHPDFVSAQLYFGDPDAGSKQKLTPQALGVFGYINSMVSDLLTGIFEDPAPGGEFSMRKLVRDRASGKTVVFIEYDLSVGEVLGPMYRLLIDLALKEALGQNGEKRGNVVFLIDEFKLLPNLMHIADALNFGRSLGVKVIAGLQCIDQIYAAYGEEQGRSILSGFMNCFCLQTPDSNTRRYAMERFGENFTQMDYRSKGVPQSYQRQGHVIEDWDLLRLDIGQAAVDLNGEHPFIFRFADFDKPHSIL